MGYKREQTPAPITVCGGPINPPSDYTVQIEFVGPVGGAGEIVNVFPTGQAADLASKIIRAEANCPSHRDGGTTSTKVPVAPLALPSVLGSTTVFCEKHATTGKPATYGCFTALGRGRILISAYGFAPTLETASDNLRNLLIVAAEIVPSLPT